MHILEAAMAAALIDRSQSRRAAELNDGLREGISGLARLALALVVLAAFFGTLELVSRVAPSDAPRVAVERSD
jgi:hypothetical protein